MNTETNHFHPLTLQDPQIERLHKLYHRYYIHSSGKDCWVNTLESLSNSTSLQTGNVRRHLKEQNSLPLTQVDKEM